MNLDSDLGDQDRSVSGPKALTPSYRAAQSPRTHAE